MATGSKLLAGLALGIVAGAAAGSLVTPNSGPENRKVVRDKASQYAQAIRERFRNNRSEDETELQGSDVRTFG